MSADTTFSAWPPQPTPHALAAGDSAAIFALPGGYFEENGVMHSEVVLTPLTGEDEYLAGSSGERAVRAEVVTGLLSRCVKRLGTHSPVCRELISDLAVGQRDFLMLKLREMTVGPCVDFVLRCPAEDCGRPMDLSLDTSAIDASIPDVGGRLFTATLDVEEPDSSLVEFRLPNGGDQEELAGLFSRDPVAALDALLVRCLRRVGDSTEVDDACVASLTPSLRRFIDERMELLSLKVDYEIEARCPECETPFEMVFDVVGHFLEELAAGFRNLEREVHFLAWHYHWSERDILSMTRRRRRRYVALVQEEVDRINQVW